MRYLLIVILILQIVLLADYKSFKTELKNQNQKQEVITVSSSVLPPNLEEVLDIN